MKLGVAGQLPKLSAATPAFLPADWRAITRVDTQRIRAHGFLGSQWFINKPLEADDADIDRVGRAFADAEVDICQLNGWYEPICSYDDALRREGVRGAARLLRIGRRVNACSVYIRPGGHNPNGHWYAHPENHSSRTFDLLVDSMKQLCAIAQDEGIEIAVEGHVLSAFDTPARMRDFFDAVASPVLKFNFDPVNFIGTVQDVHNTAGILNELDALLGDKIMVAHAKDLAIADKLVLQIDEVVPGTGAMDYALFMQLFEKRAPNGYFVIEHLPDRETLQARDFVIALAERIGIPLQHA
jgi:sugar phosphate isomerase/epimerase